MSRVQSSIEQRALSTLLRPFGRLRATADRGSLEPVERKPIIRETCTPRKDKTPHPLTREMGFCLCVIQGLRVSRLLDLREGYGPKTLEPPYSNVQKISSSLRRFAGIMEYWNSGRMHHREQATPKSVSKAPPISSVTNPRFL